MEKNHIHQLKKELLSQLKQQHCLWSYNQSAIREIPDEKLIELVMIHLDIPEINILFEIFPYQKVKQAWLTNLVPQADYYYPLNRFMAWYYFGAKKPDMYVKSMMTRHLHHIAI